MKFEDWIRHKPPTDIQFEKQWRSTYCEWAEYVVDSDILFRLGNPQVDKWIGKNLIGRCSVYHNEVYFELEEDSVLFVLRWA